MVHEGGIYMDTDVEVIAPLDSLLQYHAVSGFETEHSIPTGLMACEKGNPMFTEFLNEYKTAHFLLPDSSLDQTTNVVRITNICLKYGFIPNNQKQMIRTFTLLPQDYLCPKSFETGKTELTKNTLTIHHFNGSWRSEQEVYQTELSRKLIDYFPFIPHILQVHIAAFVAETKFNGLIRAICRTATWVKKKK